MVDQLLQNLQSPDASVRARAAYVLGPHGDDQAIVPLIAALQDTDAEVRWCAADALGWLQNIYGRDPLFAVMTSDPAVCYQTQMMSSSNRLFCMGRNRKEQAHGPLLWQSCWYGYIQTEPRRWCATRTRVA